MHRAYQNITSVLQTLLSSYGLILHRMIRFAIPAILTSLLSMVSTVVDIGFIGRLGGDYVAAVGSAGFYIHLLWALSSVITIGASIKIAHSVGGRKRSLASFYVRTSGTLTVVLALSYATLVFLSSNWLLGIFNLQSAEINTAACQYLKISCAGFLPLALNFLLSSVFLAYGNSKLPMCINIVGVAVNLILDPLLIFVCGWGIEGAAIASIVSHCIGAILFLYYAKVSLNIDFSYFMFSSKLAQTILKLGISPAFQRVLFTLIAIYMARIISQWGNSAIAVQKIGLQIEALSFMAAAGFGHVIHSMSGQYYGAGMYSLFWRTFVSGVFIAISIGVLSTVCFLRYPTILLSLLTTDTAIIDHGKEYLRIIGYSQILMCIELITTGAYYGWGKTAVPAIISIILTLGRIPCALMLIETYSSSVLSVWWSISISSMLKGLLLLALFIYQCRKWIINKKHIA